MVAATIPDAVVWYQGARARCQAVERKVEQAVGQGRTAFDVLYALSVIASRGPLPMSHIAHAVGIQTQTCTDTIDRLERKGLAVRSRHPTDRRVVLVDTTLDGALLAQAFDAALAAASAEIWRAS